MTDSTPTAEELLAHTEWLTRLARALVGDSAASDVVQDTYEVALLASSGRRGALRPWLGGVARNVARMATRGRVRRERREQLEHLDTASHEVPSPEQLLARAQVQHEVNRLVLALPEPLRATLLLRYFEGLSAADIARAQGIPAGTVRARLKDALDRLRAQLDAEHDNDRAAWAVLLAPLPAVRGSATVGAVASTHAVAIAIGLVVIAAVIIATTRLAGLWSDARDGRASVATTTPPSLGPNKLSATHPPTMTAVSTRGLPTIIDDDPKGTLRIDGQVIDEHDAPVAHAKVAIDANPPIVVETESDGAFVFEGLIQRDYRIEATAGDYYAGPAHLRVTDHPEPITLRAHDGGRIQVSVTNRATGAPVEGAEIELRSALTWTATTDAAGVAKLTGLGATSLPLVVHAASYAPATMMVKTSGNPSLVERTGIALARGASLEGRVVDEHGQAIAHARVVATSASEVLTVTNPRRDGVMTTADGSFSFPTLSAGAWRITATAGTHAPTTTAPISLDGEHARRDLEIQLRPGAVVRGLVTDATGAAVSGAEVSVVVHGYVPWRARRQAYSDATGAFAISGLEPRAVDVVAWHDRGASTVAAVDLAVNPDQHLALTLDLRGVLSGTVIDRRGRPVTDAQVVASPEWSASASVGDRAAWTVRGLQDSVTDHGGAFRFAGLPDGSYTVRAARAGAAESVLWLSTGVASQPNAPPIQIVLSDDGRVIGRVVHVDGTPVTSLSVALGSTAPLPIMTTDGTFALPATAGTYAVTIAGTGFVTTSTDIAVSEGTDVDLGTIVVESGRSISGRVVDERGIPVAGAVVVAGALVSGGGSTFYVKTESLGAKDAVTDAHGRFVLSGFPPASLTVVAGTASARSASVQLPPSAGSTALDLVLTATSSLEGKVTRNGQPLADALITASPVGAMWSSFFVTTGPDGAFAFDALAPGAYVVYPMLGRGPFPGAMYMRRVEVVQGAKAEVAIDATPGAVTLAVTVTTETGLPLPAGGAGALELAMHPQTADELRDGSQMPTDRLVQMASTAIHDGTARIEGLRPGLHTLCAMISDPRVASSVKLECKQVTLTAAVEQVASIIVPAAWR